MRYEIVGMVPAPYFFQVDPLSGDVSVKASLTNDKAFEYTVRIQYSEKRYTV